MERTELRRRADGLDRIVRIGRWGWVWPAVAAVLVVAPLALCATFDLPTEVLAIPPMTIWVAIWVVFRHLDAPPPRRPPPRSRRPTRRPSADVIPLPRGPAPAAVARAPDSTASPR